MNRGIITTIYVDLSEKIDAESLASIYQKAYGNEPFVRLLGTDRFPDSKNVSGTNFIDIAWRLDLRTGRAILMSAIDNIVKGASGQAIQCFNLMRGYPETEGLLRRRGGVSFALHIDLHLHVFGNGSPNEQVKVKEQE